MRISDWSSDVRSSDLTVAPEDLSCSSVSPSVHSMGGMSSAAGWFGAQPSRSRRMRHKASLSRLGGSVIAGGGGLPVLFWNSSAPQVTNRLTEGFEKDFRKAPSKSAPDAMTCSTI